LESVDNARDKSIENEKLKGHTFGKSAFNSRLESIQKEHEQKQLKNFHSVADFNLEKINEKVNQSTHYNENLSDNNSEQMIIKKQNIFDRKKHSTNSGYFISKKGSMSRKVLQEQGNQMGRRDGSLSQQFATTNNGSRGESSQPALVTARNKSSSQASTGGIAIKPKTTVKRTKYERTYVGHRKGSSSGTVVCDLQFKNQLEQENLPKEEEKPKKEKDILLMTTASIEEQECLNKNEGEDMYTRKRLFTKIIAQPDRIQFQWSHPTFHQ
jgi:hypothetical protein